MDSNNLPLLDEEGFVFLDQNSKPYLIRMWGENPWLFYWHVDSSWVSLRQTNQMEIFLASESKVSEEVAKVYHDMHAKKFNY